MLSCCGSVLAPSGKLIETFDTQSAPVGRATITRSKSGDDWEGYWCLWVGKAPKGGSDDVFITLHAALPQWFTLDPGEPLTISAESCGIICRQTIQRDLVEHELKTSRQI